MEFKIGDIFQYYKTHIVIKDHRPVEDVDNGYWDYMLVTRDNIENINRYYKEDSARFREGDLAYIQKIRDTDEFYKKGLWK